MPPRRRTGNPTGSQSTLSFGSQNRVTKPVTAPSTKAKALESLPSLPDKSTSATPEPHLAVTPTEPSKPPVAELVVRQQAATEVEAPQTEEDKQALKLNKQDVWRYWRTQEEARLTPRGKSDLERQPRKIQRLTLVNSTPTRNGCRGEDS